MAEVDKVKWLKENGKLPQFARNVRIIIDKDGNTTMKLEDKVNMKTKGTTK